MRISLTSASQLLAQRDPILRALYRRHGPCRLPARNPDGPFAALARAIVFQQLAGKAATAIHDRFRAALDGSVTPESVLAAPVAALRAAGLSSGKAASIRDLAAKVRDGVVRLEKFPRLADDAIVEQLVQVRGIGAWTAHMFLIFQMRRLDVWPTLDYGVRKGYAKAHGLAELPAPRALEALGEPYRPFRSVAAWYCWRATEGLAWD